MEKSFRLFFGLLFFAMAVFGQDKKSKTNFELAIDQHTQKFDSNPRFFKIKEFCFENEWDSVLVYSSKILANPVSQAIKNHTHFLRGYAFFKKNLTQQAIREFDAIYPPFVFELNVSMLKGTIALKNKQIQEAIGYFEKLENVRAADLLGIERDFVLYNLSICYMYLKDYKTSEKYLLQNIASVEKGKDTLGMIESYGNIANLYYEQYKDDLAIPYFRKAYGLALKTSNSKFKASTARNMAVVEENRKNFAKALLYKKQEARWKDSVNDQNKIWEVAQVEKEFAVKQKQKEVQLLQAENKAKIAERNGFLYSLLAVISLLLTGVYFYREKVKSAAIISKQNEQLDTMNATKDKLFSIVSHDLRASVNALKRSNETLQISLENEELAAVKSQLDTNGAIVNGAYGLLDNLLNWALLQTKQGYFNPSKLPLARIVEHVVFNYEAICKAKGLAIRVSIPRKLNVKADQESLKVVLRNLLDNAIKFTDSGGSIHIYSEELTPEYGTFIVEDTGVGMREDLRLQLLSGEELLLKKEHESKIGTGLGMQLCKSMIAKNGGIFDIQSTVGIGTKMIVSLPLNNTDG